MKSARKVRVKSRASRPSDLAAEPDQQLESFLEKFTPELEDAARRALTQMRWLIPGAIEMVYDNVYALVIGFGPSERPSEAIFSIVVNPRYVSLCFLQGATLPDPARRLRGSGNVVRNLRLYDRGKEDLHVLDDPEVRDLIKLALNHAKVSMHAAARRKLIIRAVAPKQFPRRPAVKKH